MAPTATRIASPGQQEQVAKEENPEAKTPRSARATKKVKTPQSPQTPNAAKTGEEKPKRVRTSLMSRSKASPIHTRARLGDTYEGRVSGREDWWRHGIKETPNPGAYDLHEKTFVKELDSRPNTYGFKTEGRKRDPQPHNSHRTRGETLLPGAYEHPDFLNRLEKFNTTYGFRGTSRDDKDFLNFGKKDRDINVPPNAYAMEKYLTLTAEKQATKHWQFKSQSQRFPTVHFKPKDGPAPGNYEYNSPESLHAVSSSFQSKTPRFSTSHTIVPGPGSYMKVPGPGSYDRTVQHPMPKTIMKMGRHHGIFFSSAFQV